MAGNLNDLALWCDAFPKKLTSWVNELSKKVALTIVTDLAYVTPVDTSNALSNWQLSLNTSISEEIPPYFMGEGGSTRQASAQETVQIAQNMLKSRQIGQTIYITNNAPYIKRLDEGYSKQEPAGFVNRAIVLGRVTIQSVKFRV